MMRYLSRTDLVELTPPSELVAALEMGLRHLAQQKVIVPPREHLDFSGNTLLTMPVVGERTFGVKAVSVIPSNAAQGTPIVTGLMILNDRLNGQPLAILDAAALTAQRTGAVGAIGLKITTPSDIDSIGIVGVGVQGIWQAVFACAVRTITKIYFVARSEGASRKFVESVSKHVPSVLLERCEDVASLLTRTNVVIAATTSNTPVLPDDLPSLRNRHYISVGSFKPTMQELPDAVYELAAQVVIDSDTARIEVGDLIGPMSRRILQEPQIVHLADVIANGRSLDTGGTTVFKSVGMALYDLYAAEAFVRDAERHSRGTILT